MAIPQTFDEPRVGNGFDMIAHLRLSIGEAFDDAASEVRLLLPARAEHLPIGSEPCREGFVIEKFMHDSLNRFSSARNEKLIGINESHVHTIKFVFVDGIIVSGNLRTSAGIKNVIDDPVLNVRLEHFFNVVGTFIVVNEKVIRTGEQVIVEPLFDIVRLVFEDRNNRQLISKQRSVLPHCVNLQSNLIDYNTPRVERKIKRLPKQPLNMSTIDHKTRRAPM